MKSIKNKRRKTGFYWVRLKSGKWMVAKWWHGYNWFTQMGPIHETDAIRNPIVYVHEEMIEPPVIEEAPKKVKRTKKLTRSKKPVKPAKKMTRTKRTKTKPKKIKRTRRN